ncbi:MAG: sugar ABC transporter substrate-binding protein [Chloroflexi bacterium]|nr:sugar ABC transporter substrate-binding protein [Chloroflexota bacterium]
MKVRLFLVLVIVLAVIVGCAPAPTATPVPPTAAPKASSSASSSAAPSSSAATQPFKGTTLRILVANHPWYDAMKKLVGDFQTQTGITVNMENYAENDLVQKLTTEFTAGGSNVDAFMQRPLQEGKLFAQNNWYVDLNTYVKDSKKTPDSYNFADFQKAAVGTETVKDMLTGIPIVTEQEVLYYRKDLYQAAGLQPPKTLAELEAAATKLTDKSKQQFGFIARGQGNPAVTQFSSYLYSFGGDWFDQSTKKATLNTPEAIAAFTLFGKLHKNYAPPGTTNMSWPQAVAVFAQGSVASYTDANSIFANLLDPTKSTVADKTGVVVFPEGPKGSVPYSVTSWGLSIAASSKNKDAAWEFVKWATSKEIVLKTQGDGANPGARASVWADPVGKSKFPADWVAAQVASANGRGYDRPLVVQVGAARDIIGTIITAAINGEDVTAAANKANADFQKLLDSEPK